MSSKTKIVVLRMKELIYTAVFLGLAVVLITLFLVMFRPKPDAASPSQPASYVPGIYTSSITLGSQNLNVEVAVDAQQIQSVCFVSLDEAVTTMYPLMQPVMEDLADQIVKNQSTQNLSYSLETRYTSQSLIGAIDRALEKAKVRN
ncbi:MAG: hypothetical protein HFG69_14650 [Hungatella sp.]|jgi:uncharacterized protein with FMN-binding domain|nr:hypothetical protein [Hungatella sp.]